MQAETMGLAAAAAWGLAGGLATALVSLMAAIKAAGYLWPWHNGTESAQEAQERFWARLVVLAGSLGLGALLAAAAHGQMSGPWPAFIIGVGAEASVRGMLSGVEIVARKPTETAEDEAGGELSGEDAR